MSAKVLFWDIETAPILARVWGTFEQNVSLDQIEQDWHLLSWAAKWKDSKEVMYMDQRKAKDITNDKKILEGLWKLLDEADVVVTQNGIQFDAKRVNARFIQHGMKPPSPYKHVDTLRLAKKQFGFTSNKLEYTTSKLCTKYKKLKHKKFPGQELWTECLKGNQAAWKEMEKYNKHDVLALEELYGKLAPWGAGYNPNLYENEGVYRCACGSEKFNRSGFTYSAAGKYRVFECTVCGSRSKGKVNLLSDEDKLLLKEGPLRWKVSLSRKCPSCKKENVLFVWQHKQRGDGKFRILKCKSCNKNHKIDSDGRIVNSKRNTLKKLPKKTAILIDCRCCRAKNCLKLVHRINNPSGYKNIFICTKCNSTQRGAFVYRGGTR